MYTAKQIADFFINITSNDPNSDMTNMRLNKLLYVAQVYYLHQTGHKLFADDIEAWDYGPVVYDVYQKYHNYGDRTIRETSADFDEELFDDAIADFLISVEVDTNKYSTSYLSSLTHFKGGSWAKSYNGQKRKLISVSDMVNDYDYLTKKIAHFDLQGAVRKLPKYKTYRDPDGILVVVR